MEKNIYIQPETVITSLTAMYNLLGASKVFNNGGGADDQEITPVY